MIALDAHARPVVMVIGADRPLAARVCQELAGVHHCRVIATAADARKIPSVDARKIPQQLKGHGVQRGSSSLSPDGSPRRG
ncbi:hypothetical protein [Streptomyces sp. NPDC050988]|uniref:hypothetical protein n=1 Tax=Streptomyces sp. NPDC050988 TaxID=3365637 RepID=UPI0037B8034E